MNVRANRECLPAVVERRIAFVMSAVTAAAAIAYANEWVFYQKRIISTLLFAQAKDMKEEEEEKHRN